MCAVFLCYNFFDSFCLVVFLLSLIADHFVCSESSKENKDRFWLKNILGKSDTAYIEDDLACCAMIILVGHEGSLCQFATNKTWIGSWDEVV